MDNEEVIDILETLCAEPEDGQEARLDADELDAVLEAIRVIKGKTGSWETGEDEDGKYMYCSECQKVRYRYPFFSGAMRHPRYCEYCGSLNNEGGKI